MKRFLLLAAGAALLTACETASEIDAIATGASGSSASTSTASSGSSDSSSSTSSSTSSSGASSESATTYSYDTDPKTALIKVGDRVLFGYDSSELDSDAQELLQDQVAWLKQYSDVSVIIEGHCDERGTREYNLALGEKRAQAVKNYLISLGISSDRVSTISYGKERPAVVGSNDGAWAQNRRSVTIVN